MNGIYQALQLTAHPTGLDVPSAGEFVQYALGDQYYVMYSDGIPRPVPLDTESVQDVVGGLIQGTGSISVNYDDGLDTLTISNSSVFGTEAEDFIDENDVSYTTNTAFEAYSFTTSSKPSGRYRIQSWTQLEFGNTGSNDILTLRVDGNIVGLNDGFEMEGKDTGGDIREGVLLLGYYDHTGVSTFDIEIWANQDGAGTSVLHGALVEVWRVS